MRASMDIMQNTITDLRLTARNPNDYLVIEPTVHGRNILESERRFAEIIALGEAMGNEQRGNIQNFLQGTRNRNRI